MSTPHVYQAIAEVMQSLASIGIAKNHKNAQQGFKFRGIDDIYNAMAPRLSEAGLCVLPRVLERTVTERATRNGGVLFYVVADVEYDFVSAKDGSKHTIRVCGEAMDSGDKATNKAMSAAYKYACLQTFCIPTEGDNDADATTHEVAKETPEEKELWAEAEKTAKQGMDALHAWWELIGKDRRATLAADGERWERVKSTAADFDAAREAA